MGREHRFLDGRIVALLGDLTVMKVEAVVNAANRSLLGGGGVDGAIHGSGGPEILEECREIRRTRYPDGLPPGMAVITTGGRLPARHVIHTVGPVWNDGNSGEPETLSRAYRSSLELAAENGLRTVAFPAISTGVYGYPRALAGPIAFTSVRDYLSDHTVPETVFLVFHTQPDLEVFLGSIRPFHEP